MHLEEFFSDLVRSKLLLFSLRQNHIALPQENCPTGVLTTTLLNLTLGRTPRIPAIRLNLIDGNEKVIQITGVTAELLQI